MILTAMRGYSALSRGAGNELMPESDSGLTNEIVMILTAMREMEQGVKTATLKEERLKCTDSESDEGILWNDAWQEQGKSW